MGFTTPSPLSFATIPRPAFGTAAQHLDTPKPNKRKSEARYHRAARTAAELLPELPNPGESIHCLMTGTYDLCQVITAVASPLPTLSALRIATLCFSKRNTAELLSLLETRKGNPFTLTLLVSVFFREHNKRLYEWFAEELKAHPTARLAAARNHCKVVCFDLGANDGLVFEGSANLRSNRNREQLTAIRDRQLHDWHAAWIDDMVKADDGKAA
jgi:hypothetical protein